MTPWDNCTYESILSRMLKIGKQTFSFFLILLFVSSSGGKDVTVRSMLLCYHCCVHLHVLHILSYSLSLSLSLSTLSLSLSVTLSLYISLILSLSTYLSFSISLSLYLCICINLFIYFHHFSLKSTVSHSYTSFLNKTFR